MSKTPRKMYAACSNSTSFSRLYKSVGDFSHCKNLLGIANRALLLASGAFENDRSPTNVLLISSLLVRSQLITKVSSPSNALLAAPTMSTTTALRVSTIQKEWGMEVHTKVFISVKKIDETSGLILPVLLQQQGTAL